MTKFFQAHVDGKFRVADQIVAEESKDAFFEMEKTRYLSFEILSITFSDNFTRARATVDCAQEMIVPIIGKTKMKMPRVSLWKLIDGEWFWYVNPVVERESPFGTLRPGPSAGAPGARQELPKGPSIEEVQRMVTADKSDLQVTADAAAQPVTLTNKLPGAVKLSLEFLKRPDFAVKLDKELMMQNESVHLLVSCSPAAAAQPKPFVVNVVVEPTGQVIPVNARCVPAPPPVQKPEATKPAPPASKKKSKARK